MNVGYYNHLKDQRASKKLAISEVYDLIKTGYISDTKYIQETFREGILKDFAGIDKTPYQEAKLKRLKGITFSIDEDRERSTVITRHTGIINLDIDENTREERNELRNRILNGDVPFIEACGYSVSGELSGAMWANVRVEIPKTKKAIDKEIIKILHLEDKTYPQCLEELHKAYYKALYKIFADQGIQLGTAKDLKRCRYLSHDSELYVNPNAIKYPLSALKLLLEGFQRQIRDFEKLVFNISETEAFKFAHQFAELKGYLPTEGQRHYYAVYFAIACNLLGVEKEETENHIHGLGISIRNNRINYAYKEYQESFGLWAYKLKQEKEAKVYQGKVGQKLTQIIKDPNSILGKILVAPTGSGKTYLASKIMGRIMLAVPTIALTKGVAEGYKAERVGGDRTGDQDRSKAAKSNFSVVTYSSSASFALHKDMVDRLDETNLIIDEAHNLTTSTSRGFQHKELSDLVRLFPLFKSVTLMTGTYIYNSHPEIEKKEIIRVEIPRPQKKLQVIETRDSIKSAVDAYEVALNSGQFPIILQNKKGADRKKLMELLPKGTESFSSDSKENPLWESLITKELIPEKVKGFVTTSVYGEGNNILDPLDFVFIILGHDISVSFMEQLSNRPRKAKSIEIILIRHYKREMKGRFARDMDLCQAEMIKSQAKADYLNGEGKQRSDQSGLNDARHTRSLGYPAVIWDTKKSQFDSCHLLASNAAHGRQTYNENFNHDVLVQRLAVYGIEVLPTIIATDERTAEDKAKSAAAVSKYREKKAEDFKVAIEEMEDKGVIKALKIAQNDKDSLTPGEKEAYEGVERLVSLNADPDKALQVVAEIGDSKAKIKDVSNKLTTMLLKNDTRYMALATDLGKIINYTDTELVGKSLNVDSLLDQFKKVLGENGADIQNMPKKKVLKVLGWFCDFEKQRVKENGVREYRLIIEKLDIESLLNTTTPGIMDEILVRAAEAEEIFGF